MFPQWSRARASAVICVSARWPTIPQLYVKGEFIGGSDILMEMYEAGELQALLQEKQVARAE